MWLKKGGFQKNSSGKDSEKCGSGSKSLDELQIEVKEKQGYESIGTKKNADLCGSKKADIKKHAGKVDPDQDAEKCGSSFRSLINLQIEEKKTSQKEKFIQFKVERWRI